MIKFKNWIEDKREVGNEGGMRTADRHSRAVNVAA